MSARQGGSRVLERARVALVGLPGAGKTTYVAALWNLIQHPKADCAIELQRRPLQAAYLEELHQAWLDGRVVGHTSRDVGELIEIDVLMNGIPASVEIPDLSGESFERALVSRKWSAEVAALIAAANGLLFFLQPADLRPRLSVLSARKLGAIPSPDLKPVDFDVRKLPADVLAVDLLQVVMHHRAIVTGAPIPLRLSFVISAWDSLAAEGLSPRSWLEHRLPLLHQFLQANRGPMPYRVFGVSAQGGDYRDMNLPAIDPAIRAWVVEATGERHADVSMPLCWALTG
jgi:hypothetical protein